MKKPHNPNKIAKLFFAAALIFASLQSAVKSSAQCTATLTASNDTICIYGSVVLQSAPVGLYDYQWFMDGQLSILGPESWTYMPGWNDTGTHTFSVQITDFNNCTVISNTVTVVVLDEPIVQPIGQGYYCAGGSVPLDVGTNNGKLYCV